MKTPPHPAGVVRAGASPPKKKIAAPTDRDGGFGKREEAIPHAAAPQESVLEDLLNACLSGRPGARLFLADGRTGAPVQWREIDHQEEGNPI